MSDAGIIEYSFRQEMERQAQYAVGTRWVQEECVRTVDRVFGRPSHRVIWRLAYRYQAVPGKPSELDGLLVEFDFDGTEMLTAMKTGGWIGDPGKWRDAVQRMMPATKVPVDMDGPVVKPEPWRMDPADIHARRMAQAKRVDSRGRDRDGKVHLGRKSTAMPGLRAFRYWDTWCGRTVVASVVDGGAVSCKDCLKLL